MLKVSDENSANAIMVFTIVATVFLPLSWATSYFGMNTADIRELKQGQWVFWCVAGPLASAVIGVAVLAAWKGEKIREYMIRRRWKGVGRRERKREGVGRMGTTLSLVMGTRRGGKREGEGVWGRARWRGKKGAKEVGDV